MENFFKDALNTARKHKEVPVVYGGNYIDMLKGVREKAEQKGYTEDQKKIIDFYHGENKFYKSILKETAVFFGAGNFKQYDDAAIFAAFAGRPHIDKSEYIEGGPYAEAHDEYFGTDVEQYMDPDVRIAPHHCIWLLGKNGSISWDDMIKNKPEIRQDFFKLFSELTLKDKNFLKSASGKNILTSVAVGFDHDDAAQSVETIHAHNLVELTQDVSLGKIPVDKEIRSTDIINPYVYMIKEIFSEEFKQLVDESMAGAEIACPGCEVSRTEDPYDQISFKIKFQEGVVMEDILESIALLYEKLKQVWSYALGETGDLGSVSKDEQFNQEFASKLVSIRRKDSRRFPKVPSFNNIIKWNDDNKTISSVTIAPSVRGPAERMRGGALIRK